MLYCKITAGVFMKGGTFSYGVFKVSPESGHPAAIYLCTHVSCVHMCFIDLSRTPVSSFYCSLKSYGRRCFFFKAESWEGPFKFVQVLSSHNTAALTVCITK